MIWIKVWVITESQRSMIIGILMDLTLPGLHPRVTFHFFTHETADCSKCAKRVFASSIACFVLKEILLHVKQNCCKVW